jgi:hypothetical protein
MLRRITCIAGTAIFVLLSMGRVSAADDKDDLELLTKDLGISLWDESYSVRTGVGYKDNVLLEESDARQSPFFINGLELTIFRLPVDPWVYYFFMTGDDIRYWRNVGVGSEDLWIAAAKIRHDTGSGWQEGVTASYAYEAQVLDLLQNEEVTTATTGPTQSNLAPAKVIGNTILLRPYVRKELFGTNYWLELQLEGTRQFFGAPAFSYWLAGPKILLGRNYGQHSEVSLGWSIEEQWFNGETQVDSSGNDIPGTQLAYWKQKVELASRHYWDAKRAWESTTTLNFEIAHDNGSGYFNYYRYGAAEQLDFEKRGWKVSASASFSDYEYPNQTVNDTAGTQLYQTGVTLNLRVERTIVTWMKLFAEYEYEKAFSNEFTEHYRVNTVKGGASWEF